MDIKIDAAWILQPGFMCESRNSQRHGPFDHVIPFYIYYHPALLIRDIILSERVRVSIGGPIPLKNGEKKAYLFEWNSLLS